MALLLTLGLVEVYGAYLSWWILRPYLKTNSSDAFFSQAYMNALARSASIAVNVGGISIAGVGMLTAATGALPFALMGYHCYLIWAGMTTNESSKWGDWREDMRDGFVYKASRKDLHARDELRKYDCNSVNGDIHDRASVMEPYVSWPISSDQIIWYAENKFPPAGEQTLWTQIWKLRDVDNLYDLGGWDNLVEVLKGR